MGIAVLEMKIYCSLILCGVMSALPSYPNERIKVSPDEFLAQHPDVFDLVPGPSPPGGPCSIADCCYLWSGLNPHVPWCFCFGEPGPDGDGCSEPPSEIPIQ